MNASLFTHTSVNAQNVSYLEGNILTNMRVFLLVIIEKNASKGLMKRKHIIVVDSTTSDCVHHWWIILANLKFY